MTINQPNRANKSTCPNICTEFEHLFLKSCLVENIFYNITSVWLHNLSKVGQCNWFRGLPRIIKGFEATRGWDSARPPSAAGRATWGQDSGRVNMLQWWMWCGHDSHRPGVMTSAFLCVLQSGLQAKLDCLHYRPSYVYSQECKHGVETQGCD